jgi:carbamoyltransferase
VNILGLNYFFHDSTACVVRDGVLVAAVEEERLNRQKHTIAFPSLSAAKVLELAGLEPGDVDHVAVSIKPTLNVWPRVVHAVRHLPRARRFVGHEFINAYFKQENFWDWYRGIWPDKEKGPRVHFVPHHLSHAPGSFFVSPFESAALLGLDGAGEWATSYLGKGEGNRITCYNQSYFPHSLGSFYEAVTQFCGFRPNYDEGKTMGLAPFGDPEVHYPTVSGMAQGNGRGDIEIDLSYFRYQHHGHERCSPRFFETFGQPRRRGEEFQDRHKNAAAAFQKVLEERALGMARFLREKTGERHLVLSGGVALNSVMNGRILREAGFDDIYVMPGAGDNGTAIGAAHYVWNAVLDQPKRDVHDDPYLGTEYSNDDLRKVLQECKLESEYREDITGATAELLAQGNIVAWFQGKMEVGPRALGNRSILADPSPDWMKDRINAQVKHREAYRPFAPSVPVEHANDYFDMKGESPFMLKVCDVLPEKRGEVPAITHVDGTARVQTVNRNTNPRYHELINEFGERTGVPVILNTSFNIMGQPIIESPLDAIRCFYSTGLDALVLGNHIVRKTSS